MVEQLPSRAQLHDEKELLRCLKRPVHFNDVHGVQLDHDVPFGLDALALLTEQVFAQNFDGIQHAGIFFPGQNHSRKPTPSYHFQLLKGIDSNVLVATEFYANTQI